MSIRKQTHDTMNTLILQSPWPMQELAARSGLSELQVRKLMAAKKITELDLVRMEQVIRALRGAKSDASK